MSSQAQTTQLQVDGMSCDGCARRLQNVLQQSHGVDEAKVSFDRKLATVIHDTTQVSRDDLVRQVEQAGFQVTQEA